MHVASGVNQVFGTRLAIHDMVTSRAAYAAANSQLAFRHSK
jgi:hypothetical protein